MCVRVLLTDDTPLMRKAIRSVLGQEPEIEVVAEAENFAESLSMTREFKPHVVILDLHIPESSNLTPMNVSEGLRAYRAAVLAFLCGTMRTPGLWRKAMALRRCWIKCASARNLSLRLIPHLRLQSRGRHFRLDTLSCTEIDRRSGDAAKKKLPPLTGFSGRGRAFFVSCN
jgi:Response regulator receiver domain